MLNLDTIDRDEQREHALLEANHRRTAVAQIKTRLRQRTLTLAELLCDPPAAIEHVLTWEVLRWAPGVGATRVQRLNVRAARQRQVNLALPLGRLTDRQRHWLADQLPQQTMSPDAALFVVSVIDDTNPTLSGHPRHAYTSPPQSAEQALALTALLLGRPQPPTVTGQQPAQWRCPIAGGQRTVSLHPPATPPQGEPPCPTPTATPPTGHGRPDGRPPR